MGWGWASYDIDDDENEYTSQTDVHDDGTVHRYDSIDGNWSTGHNHTVYNSMNDFVNDNSRWNRGINNSYGRNWKDKH